MSFLRRFIPLAILATCLSGIIYVTAQQSLRLGANDPQIQLAEDTVSQLTTQDETFMISKLPRIDMAKSLASFVIIYGADGKPISSSGILDGKIPVPPMGVFAYSKEHVDDRFTWQPQEGVRIAAVVKHYSGRTTGFVLAGRSLSEVESREDTLVTFVGFGYGVSLVLLLITTFLFQEKRKK